MAGHSKWHQIKHKKGANDAKRGKIFTKHARLIAIAAKQGSDPLKNPTLRAAIDYAKSDNLPNDNIERAIKKGAGELGEEQQMHEVLYEGFGPAGTALLILGITDNKNRTFANIRTIMSKNGGNLGESGSVSYLFEKKGYFLIHTANHDIEQLELEIIENMPVLDLEHQQNELILYSSLDNFHNLQKALLAKKLTLKEQELTFFPMSPIHDVNDSDLEKLENLINKLEEDDDVFEVITNLQL